jgi:hypothetical protein
VPASDLVSLPSGNGHSELSVRVSDGGSDFQTSRMGSYG